MKLRSLILRAREIIEEENVHVYDDFKEDDGTITLTNHIEAVRLKVRMERWLEDASRVLGENTPREKSKKRRHPARQSKHKIVIQH